MWLQGIACAGATLSPDVWRAPTSLPSTWVRVLGVLRLLPTTAYYYGYYYPPCTPSVPLGHPTLRMVMQHQATQLLPCTTTCGPVCPSFGAICVRGWWVDGWWVGGRCMQH